MLPHPPQGDRAERANAGLDAYLRARSPGVAPRALANDGPDPYWQSGCHPDIVDRVWNGLGAGLPADARQRVFGRPGLVDPGTQVVLALALGTMHALRLRSDDLMSLARDSGDAAGFETGPWRVWRWDDATTLAVAIEWGPDWVVGRWDAREPAWCHRRFVAP